MNHTYLIQLRRTDIDAFGHVNNVVYVNYLDEARADLLATHAPEGRPWGVVVARHRLTYNAPLLFRGDPIRVETVVRRIGTTSFTLGHEVRDDERAYLTAESVLVMVDDGRPRPLSATERAVLEKFEA